MMDRIFSYFISFLSLFIKVDENMGYSDIIFRLKEAIYYNFESILLAFFIIIVLLYFGVVVQDTRKK